MNKRIASAGLWFFAAAYAGSMLHGIAGLHELVGPVLGLATATLIVVDPVRRVAMAQAASPGPREMVAQSDRLPRAA